MAAGMTSKGVLDKLVLLNKLIGLSSSDYIVDGSAASVLLGQQYRCSEISLCIRSREVWDRLWSRRPNIPIEKLATGNLVARYPGRINLWLAADTPTNGVRRPIQEIHMGTTHEWAVACDDALETTMESPS